MLRLCEVRLRQFCRRSKKRERKLREAEAVEALVWQMIQENFLKDGQVRNHIELFCRCSTSDLISKNKKNKNKKL